MRRLCEALKGRHREAWVDWKDIRPAEGFMQAIYSAIEGADTERAKNLLAAPDADTAEDPRAQSLSRMIDQDLQRLRRYKEPTAAP